jgi:uncharacterized protein (DUF1501 family)
MLAGASLAALGWLARPTAIAQVALNNKNPDTNTVVVVFLRGGADGLNIVVPYADEYYYKARPSLALGGPKNGPTRKLDTFFSLHPALDPIKGAFDEGELAFIHACGSGDRTRSHFEAMNAMERGLSEVHESASTGWIARYLASTESGAQSPLRAVAISAIQPDSLRGATHATTLGSLEDFRLTGSDEFQARLKNLYGPAKDEVKQAGHETLTVLDSLKKLDYSAYAPRGKATYPETGMGQGFRQAAFLIKAKVGVEFVALDMGGWDTHVAQGTTVGWHAGLLAEVGNCLAAFREDMGLDLAKTTVIVQTEFGRRVSENAGLGTDHGHGGVMMALGGGIKGGKVYGSWPGLAPEHLAGPGDLQVTTDYRNVLTEILRSRLALKDVGAVFPGLRETAVGLT